MLKRSCIFFDFAGTLVKMRPASLLANRNLLEKLAKKYRLGIITGARKSETFNILRKINTKSLFSNIITLDDSPLRKPDPKLLPEAKVSAYVGDTKKDFLLARNANIPFLRVSKKCNINQILKRLNSGMWQIELFLPGSDKSPVADFFDSLELTDMAKVRNVLRLLQEFGPKLREPYSKKVTSYPKLFELRTSGKSPVRLLYTVWLGKFVILSGFVKKSNKTPLKEIKTALSRKAKLT